MPEVQIIYAWNIINKASINYLPSIDYWPDQIIYFYFHVPDEIIYFYRQPYIIFLILTKTAQMFYLENWPLLCCLTLACFYWKSLLAMIAQTRISLNRFVFCFLPMWIYKRCLILLAKLQWLHLSCVCIFKWFLKCGVLFYQFSHWLHLLALQSGALRISAYRDFQSHPIHPYNL